VLHDLLRFDAWPAIRARPLCDRREMSLKRLLFMCEYPPSSIGGGPIIVRQLLGRYDQSRLHVLCDADQLRIARLKAADTLLDCPHTAVVNLAPTRLRPRRLFGRLSEVVNLARLPLVVRRATRLVRAGGHEAIFTVPWGEFALAAYEVSRRTAVPLFVFETDDWVAAATTSLNGRLRRRYQPRLLHHADHVWLISPRMVEGYRRRLGIDGEFLFHFVDPERYQRAVRRRPAASDVLRVVYTGAINTMFLGAMERICGWINAGMAIEGRRVVLDIYGGACPPALVGSGVTWRGFVRTEEIPVVLAEADALLIAVTFSPDAKVGSLVRTSIYTKTIDYLASGRPIVLVSPRDTAEVDYFGAVTRVVDELDRGRFADALREAASGGPEVARRIEAGLALVRERHTGATMGERFLAHFRAEA
jgi:glycosyltransferase involved in cell wall biosynthesis